MIILASRSIIRQKLLQDAGVKFHVLTSNIDEAADENSTASPKTIAQNLAAKKAIAVSTSNPTALVIGCDQTMECDGEIVTKPNNRQEAQRQLHQLRGKSHQLHSAVTVARNGKIDWLHCSTVTLHVRNFSEDFLESYLKQISDETLVSVGCYQLEQSGIQLMEKIDGDHHSILGLPLLPLLHYLRSVGQLAT